MKNFLLFLLLTGIIAGTGCREKSVEGHQAGIISRGNNPQINRFEEEIRKFEQLDQEKMPPAGAILFTGSSSIRLWNTLEQDFTPLPVIRRGFGGATLPELLHYAERIIYKYKPALVVVYCGENDIAEGNPPPLVFQNFKKFVGDLEKNLNKTSILYLSAKPSPQRWNLWRSFQQFNTMAEQFAKNRPNLTFFDTSKTLLNSTGLPDESLFTEDKLHLNATGYQRWTSALKPLVTELYEKRPK